MTTMDAILVVVAIVALAAIGFVVWQIRRFRVDVGSGFESVRQQIAAEQSEIKKLKEVVAATDEHSLALVEATDRHADQTLTLARRIDDQVAAVESFRKQALPLVIRSPIEGLSFTDALSIRPMWNGIESSATELMMLQFTSQLGDGIVAATNAIRFVKSTGEYVIEFSQHGRQLLKVGQATLMKSKETGRMIPQLLGLDGRIIETGKEAGKLGSVAGKLANLSSIVIGAAHIISGADVVKKVAEVGRDVKFLLEARQNEQMAKLEAIFHSAQQILGEPLTEHAQWELRRQMREIAEVRATWRRDLETKLNRVNDPNSSGFFQHYFRTQHSKDKQVAGGISECQQDLALLEMSMVLQIGLAESVGVADAFFNRALPSELNLLRGTAALLHEKAAYISGNSSDVHVEPMIAAIAQLIDRMSALTANAEIEPRALANNPV
jgi:hypothetical protein